MARVDFIASYQALLKAYPDPLPVLRTVIPTTGAPLDEATENALQERQHLLRERYGAEAVALQDRRERAELRYMLETVREELLTGRPGAGD